MTPVHIIATALSTASYLRKMNRDGYSKWKRNEEQARERAKEFKEQRMRRGLAR